MSFINTFFNSILHLLYPNLCEGCGSDNIGKQQIVCLDCFANLPLTNFHLYPDNPVEKVFWGRIPLVAASAHVFFTKASVIQQLLHSFKYKGNREVGLFFGRQMGQNFSNCKRYSDVDALIPLPLHYKREKKRGYNQARIICEGISEMMNVPVLNDVVIRKSETSTQTKKSRSERWQNIGNKFELINKDMITKRHVLLVDDVITTGATLEACGSEIIKAEGTRLSIASLAYTSK